MSKVLRKGEFIEVEEIEPGDIVVITSDRVPIGHVAIVPDRPTEEWKGLYPDLDIDWDDMEDEGWEDENE